MWRKILLFGLGLLVATAILPGGMSSWQKDVKISGEVTTVNSSCGGESESGILMQKEPAGNVNTEPAQEKLTGDAPDEPAHEKPASETLNDNSSQGGVENKTEGLADNN